MKLSTDILRKLCAEYVVKEYDGVHWPTCMEDEMLEEAKKPSNWKRRLKMPLKSMMKRWFIDDIKEVHEHSDAVHILCDDPLTDDCIVRHFVIDDLTLDCTVISDPTDQKVLMLLWHQD